jgi:hypothetical protein
LVGEPTILGVWSAILPEPPNSLWAGLDPNAVINCRTNPLLAAKIALGGLNGDAP